jgi:hypothetical protein
MTRTPATALHLQTPLASSLVPAVVHDGMPHPQPDECRDAAVLASGELDIQALEHATNLRELIEQLEHGDVQRICDKYGPQQGHMAHPMWSKIKVTINRRERLYHQLMDPGEFNGDKEQFLISSQLHVMHSPKFVNVRSLTRMIWRCSPTGLLLNLSLIGTEIFERREKTSCTRTRLACFLSNTGMRGGVMQMIGRFGGNSTRSITDDSYVIYVVLISFICSI